MTRVRIGWGYRLAASLVVIGGLGFQLASAQMQREPRRDSGAAVFGAYEGWFRNPDGSFGLLVGYYNRNAKQELDIPIGAANRIEPGGPDVGQPTHFMSGRQWGVFVIHAPADFGKNKYTWTLTANGQTTSIPLGLHPDYEISPFSSTASVVGKPGAGNTPPVLRFEEKGKTAQGPVPLVIARSAKAGVPLPLTLFAEDDAAIVANSGAIPSQLGSPVTATWSKYRGPGAVTFESNKPVVQKAAGHEKGGSFAGAATTRVTFNEPGNYVLRLQLNDFSGAGGGGFQCCWTNGEVAVSVTP